MIFFCTPRRVHLLALAAIVAILGVGCDRAPVAVKPAAPSTNAAVPQSAPTVQAAGAAQRDAGATPVKPPVAAADAENKPAPKAADAAAAAKLPKGVDAKDLDPAEIVILVQIIDEQFDPCGKPRSFRGALDSGDCALATRLVRFVVHKLQQGYGKRKIVGLLLREIERLNTVVQVDVSAAPRLGPANAKVNVAVFSDFECPYCRRAAEPVIKLQKHYGVAVYFLHYPLRTAHPHAEGAARAAWAAHRQGKFWLMHDALFANAPDLAWPQVQKYAKAAGLDMKRFVADVESDASKAAVDADYEQGRKAGVDGTPTYFVNGRRAETMEQLQDGIRESLGLAGVAELPAPIVVGSLDDPDTAEPDAAEAAAANPAAAVAAPVPTQVPAGAAMP